MAVNYRQKVVDIALSYVGTKGGSYSGDDKFIQYYNQITGSSFSVSATPWCAIYATYCERTAGVPVAYCNNFASCTDMFYNWLKPKGYAKMRTSGYTPKTGDLIFFNWSRKTTPCNHVGIVYKVTSSMVYTVEGNSTAGTSISAVRKKSYSRNSSYIVGYGAIPYESIPGNSSGGSSSSTTSQSTYIKKFQSWMNTNYRMGLAVDGSFGPASKKAAIKTLQTIMNKEYGKSLAIDGSFGPATKSNIKAIQQGATGNLVYVGQGCLYGKGYNPNGFDGSFGPGMKTAIGSFQSANGLTKDYSCGPLTWAALVK